MKQTPEKMTAFCAALAETCQVAKACTAVGISRQTAYNWRERDEDFARAWKRSLQIGLTVLEDEAIRRGAEGYLEPVFYQGKENGTVRKYSDSLLVFMLKAYAPEKYREKSGVELTGVNGGPVNISDGERAARVASLLAAADSRKEEEGVKQGE